MDLFLFAITLPSLPPYSAGIRLPTSPPSHLKILKVFPPFVFICNLKFLPAASPKQVRMKNSARLGSHDDEFLVVGLAQLILVFF